MLHACAAVLVVVALACPFATADTLTIEHSAVGCVVAEKFPHLEARLAPPEVVAKARVLFQPHDGAHWYAVAMRPDGPVFRGVLPKPKKSLAAFRYYIEVTDTSANTTRTGDQTANVVGSATECQGKVVAGALGSASVALEVPAGAPAVPVGFASGGVATASGAAAGAAGAASAGGGFPTALVIGAAGAAAAGGAIVVAKSHGPSGKTYSGSFTGEYAQTSVAVGSTLTVTCTTTLALAGTTSVRLEESNGSVNGDFQATGTMTQTQVTAGCSGLGNLQLSHGCRFSGSSGAFSCRFQNDFTNSEGTITNTFEFSGALSGGGITGTVTMTASGRLVQPGAVATITGSGAYSVNLR